MESRDDYIYIFISPKKWYYGSSKHTYNIINKENTISKHKVNMTIISLVKNMTIKRSLFWNDSPQLINFSFISRNVLVCLAKTPLGSSKPNMCWQVLTMLMSEVFSNFMNSLFTTKSNELISRFLSGHVSIPNINAGMHLVLISSRTVSSDAILPTLPNIALAER